MFELTCMEPDHSCFIVFHSHSKVISFGLKMSKEIVFFLLVVTAAILHDDFLFLSLCQLH